jgi:hypothetical protein
VLAADLDRGAGLAQETLDGTRLRAGLWQQEFEGDALPELHVLRGNHDAHPPDAQDALDPVLSRQGFAHLHGCAVTHVPSSALHCIID